ncbi:MAG: hypothetical protein ABSF82_14485 [Candidatus Bathyarchaeia archaeon]
MCRTYLALLLLVVTIVGTPWNLAMAFGSAYAHVPETTAPGIFQEPRTTRPENFTELGVLQNGDFENGLQGWTIANHFVGGGNGYPSISAYLVHSGSAALALNFLSSNFGGGTGQPLELTGVFQAVDVRELRGLHVEAWFMMLGTVSQIAARMRVQVGEFTVNYYVAYDSEQHLRQYDTVQSKSIFVYQAGLGSSEWLHLNRDVGEDLHSLFGPQGLQIFEQNKTTITLGLELMGFGYIPTYQIMLWDDVQAAALVPMNSTETTTTTTTTASSTTAVSTSAPVTVAISTATYSSKTSSIGTPTEAMVLGLFPPIPFYVAVAVVLVLAGGFAMAALLRGKQRRTGTGIRCGSCGYDKDIRPTDNYCPRCGMRLSPGGVETAVSA